MTLIGYTDEEVISALELFDKGIPDSIEHPSLKTYLNGHRWGWHQQMQLYCPACARLLKEMLQSIESIRQQPSMTTQRAAFVCQRLWRQTPACPCIHNGGFQSAVQPSAIEVNLLTKSYQKVISFMGQTVTGGFIVAPTRKYIPYKRKAPK